MVVLARAVAILLDLVVNSGVVAEDPVGNVQVTNCCPGRQAPVEATCKVSVPKSPVSSSPKNRFPVVFV